MCGALVFCEPPQPGRRGSSPARRCMTRVAIAVALQFTLLCVASAALRAQTSSEPVTSQAENISPVRTSSQSSAPVPSRADATVHGGTIFGSVKQGTIPLSGVLIIVRNEETKNKFTTITDGA